MANWEKLNKEFDEALDSMTKEDWKSWYERFKQKQINQNKMKKLFIPYELAVKLKALGFNEPCFYWYTSLGHFVNAGKSNQPTLDYACSAPTFSQAFRWFREKGYRYTISFDSFMKNGMFYFEIWENGKCLFETDFDYNTYEEAELACLTKLIEIVETRTK